MFHLFNKVYVISDNLIDINFDRVVISEKYGIQMSNELDKVSYGELLMYSDTFANLNKSFDEFIKDIDQHSKDSKKRMVVYVDDKAFMELVVNWGHSLDYCGFIPTKNQKESIVEKQSLFYASRIV